MMSFLTSSSRASGQFSYVRMVLRLRIPLAAATMAFALLGLAASFANLDALLRPLGDRAATHPMTALCLFAIGFAALRLKRFEPTPIWRYLLGAVVIGICMTRLMSAITLEASSTGGFPLFGPFSGFQGQFSIESAIALGAFAMAGLLRQSMGRLGMMFLAVGLATVLNSFLAISYGQIFFNGDVGAFSLLGLSCAGLAMVTLYIHRPFVRVAFLTSEIGAQTRVMAVAAVLIPWASGFFLHTFNEIGGLSAPIEAGMISVIIISMLFILLTSAARHNGADAARRRAERDVAMLNRIDPLTKAFNRFGMSEALEAAWVDFKSSGSQFGMLLLDVNYFKRINDTFGRDAGEDVLERVAATIQPHLRGHDALGRWSGEEFLILLKLKDVGDLDVVATRLKTALRDVDSPFCAGLDGEPMRITASFGLGDMRADDSGPIDAMRRADHGLYLAKEKRRDRGGADQEAILDSAMMMFEEDEALDLGGDDKGSMAA